MVNSEVVTRGFMRLISEWSKHRNRPADVYEDSILLTMFINDEIEREQKSREIYAKEEFMPMKQ